MPHRNVHRPNQRRRLTSWHSSYQLCLVCIMKKSPRLEKAIHRDRVRTVLAKDPSSVPSTRTFVMVEWCVSWYNWHVLFIPSFTEGRLSVSALEFLSTVLLWSLASLFLRTWLHFAWVCMQEWHCQVILRSRGAVFHGCYSSLHNYQGHGMAPVSPGSCCYLLDRSIKDVVKHILWHWFAFL